MMDGFPELFGNDGHMLGYDGAVDVVRAVADRSPSEIVQQLQETVKIRCEGTSPGW